MARLSRIVVPLTPHHVTQRGNRRMAIFTSSADFELYRDLLAERLKLHAVTCSAYCLMPNHVHLLLTPMHEEASVAGAALSSLPPKNLAELINAVPIKLTGVAPIARAISTAGGISFDELDADFMIRRSPGTFASGEMLDWEAPTGGYLLQASFATGAAAGRGALKWLGKRIANGE